MATKINRIALTFNDAENKSFMVLAELEGKKPATLAAEIIKAYMKDRADDIKSVLAAKEAYEKTLAKARKNSQ